MAHSLNKTIEAICDIAPTHRNWKCKFYNALSINNKRTKINFTTEEENQTAVDSRHPINHAPIPLTDRDSMAEFATGGMTMLSDHDARRETERKKNKRS